MIKRLLKAALTTVLGILILLPLSAVAIILNIKNVFKNFEWIKLGKGLIKVIGVFTQLITGLFNIIGIFSSTLLNATAGLLIRNIFTNSKDKNHLFGKIGVTTSMALGRAENQLDFNPKGWKLIMAVEKALFDKNHFKIAYRKYLDNDKISGF
tara:strand:+ start:1763 stop:2221 length:459 start_codon:yes stop_codon:yes gene_type:complete